MTPLSDKWWAELLRLARVLKDEAELDGRMNRGTNRPAGASAWRDFKRHVETRHGALEATPPAVRAVLGLCAPGDWPGDSVIENGHFEHVCAQCAGKFYGHERRVICQQCAKVSVNNKAFVPARVPRPRIERSGGLDDLGDMQGPEEL